MSGRHDLPERDTEPTGFTQILQNLIEALPGVAGAALVDELGECVDYAGVLEEMKGNEGALSLKTRQSLALKAFQHTAAYDKAIAAYLGEKF